MSRLTFGVVRRVTVLGALLVLTSGLLLALPAVADAPAAVTVSMKDFAFMPATITVKQGGRVTWTYDESASDPMPNCETVLLQPPSPVTCPGHSSTAVDKGSDGKPLWDSGIHRADGFPFSVTFSTPGKFHYICVVHGGADANNPITHMEGDVIVEAAAAAAPATTAPAKVEAATADRSVLAVTGRSWSALAVAGAALVLALACLGVRRRFE